MLGVFAEFETNLRRGRQMEGIAKTKQLGVYKGGVQATERLARVEPDLWRSGPHARLLRSQWQATL